MAQQNTSDNPTATNEDNLRQADQEGDAGVLIQDVVENPLPSWQSEKKNSCERLIHLKSSMAFTDVVLKFQPAGEIKAHSVILAMTSSVFERMIYGNCQRNADDIKVVEIANVKFETFQLLFSYIYGGIFKLKTIAEAIDLHKAADMYLLYHLKDLCVDFMLKYMTPKTTPAILNYAILISNNILRDGTLDLVRNSAMEVLTCAGFLQLGHEAVRVIIGECRLVVTEIQLFTALVDWSVKMVKSDVGTAVNKGVLQDFWKTNGLYKLIQFQKLTPVEFGQCSKMSLVFSYKESFEIISFLSGSGNKLPLILGCNAVSPVYNNAILEFRFEVKGPTENKEECFCTIAVKSSFNICLLGFKTLLNGRVEVRLEDAESDSKKILFFNNEDIKTGKESVPYLFNEVVRCNAYKELSLVFIFKSVVGSGGDNAVNYEQFPDAPNNIWSKEVKQGEVVAECKGNVPEGGIALMFNF